MSIGRDVVLGHDRIVLASAAENAAMDLGMQGLDPAIHDLGEAGMLGDFD